MPPAPARTHRSLLPTLRLVGSALLLGTLLTATACSAAVGRDQPLDRVPLYTYAFQATRGMGPDGKPELFSPEELAELDGYIMCCGIKTGSTMDARWVVQMGERMRQARAAAAARGRTLDILIQIRPDLYQEWKDEPRVPGFRDEWLMRTRRAQHEADRHRLEAGGYRVVAHSRLAPGFLDRLLGPDLAPCFYGPIDHRARLYRASELLTDLRNPDYRAWHIAWVRELLDSMDADGVTLDMKTGWHAAPMREPTASPRRGNHGGPLSPTPYGPGEFEAAISAYVLELARLDTVILVTDWSPAPGRQGMVLSREARAAVLGLASHHLVPGARKPYGLLGRRLDPKQTSDLPR